MSESRLPWLETTLWTRLGLSLPPPEERKQEVIEERVSVLRRLNYRAETRTVHHTERIGYCYNIFTFYFYMDFIFLILVFIKIYYALYLSFYMKFLFLLTNFWNE